ncbi:MAG TPA: NmrA family transcriptional regulator [Microscillaceae bacterium]|nr:NmrA family transcriptional regulator [Microscillaceae bacterium]
MKNQQILVIGGTGKTGRRVVERLTQAGHQVRIGSRNADIPFDWHQPATWTNALTGMDAVYITFQPDLAVPGSTEAIEGLSAMAVNLGVQKLVLLSGRGEKEAQACEKIVMNAGTSWTIVRADWFHQNFSESFFLDPILAGHVALPRAEARIPFVDVEDIADIVTAALTDDQHNGNIYELTGPRLLSFEEVVLEIAKVTGRNIQYHAISMDEYNQLLKQHQLPDSYIWLINYLFDEVLDGRNANLTQDVEKVLGRPARDFSDYAKQTALTGVWHPQV